MICSKLNIGVSLITSTREILLLEISFFMILDGSTLLGNIKDGQPSLGDIKDDQPLPANRVGQIVNKLKKP